MWQKIKEFSGKDPLIFTIIIAIIIVGGGFAALQSMHMTSSAKFCRTCHAKEEVAVRGEYYTWRKGVHSEVGVSCLDCHGAPGIQGYLKAHVVAGIRSLYHEILTPEEEVIKDLTRYASTVEGAEHAASEEACAFCHTDSANAEMRRNRVIKVAGEFRFMDEVVNPKFRKEFGLNDVMSEGVSAGVEPNHKAHTDAGIGCLNCHLGIGHSGERFKKPEMETCFTCHDEVRATAPQVPANDSCETCHVEQKQIQQGTYVKDLPGDQWYMADLACSDCHESAFVRPNSNKCVSCHDDSYAGIMTDFQKSFNEKLPAALKLRDEMMAERESMPEGKRELANQLIYIVKVLANDGSQGVHNPEYFDTMFEKVSELEKAVAEYVEPVEAEEHAEPMHQEAAAHEEEKAEEKPAGPVNSEERMSILEGLEQLNLAERHVPSPTKPAVIFEHKEHASRLACENCHSDPEGGVLKFEVTEVKGTKNPFHTELCIKCHKEEKVSTSCNTCHKK